VPLCKGTGTKQLKVDYFACATCVLQIADSGLGHGEGGGVYTTLLSYTLYPNGHTGTDTRPGVWLCNKPTDQSVCVIEEREHEGGTVV
jgi:hypothetical protein